MKKRLLVIMITIGLAILVVQYLMADSSVVKNDTKKAEKNMPKEIIGKDGTKMVLIPAGKFKIGSKDGTNSDEKPVHTVYIDAFYMDIYEVTNAQYKKFVDATGYRASYSWKNISSKIDAPNQPVVGVSWDDASAYAKWAGKRLPTEAEWEKAARGGLSGKRYPWGDTITHDDVNYYAPGGNAQWVLFPVGSFKPNGYGLYDVAGNVFEWCADWYDENYYAVSPNSNPTGPSFGKYRVLRGGSWHIFNYVDALRVAHRFGSPLTTRHVDIGFRCVVQE